MNYPPPIDDQFNVEQNRLAEQLGRKIERLLMLRRSREHSDRFDTAVGDKTHAGLARTVLRVFTDEDFTP